MIPYHFNRRTKIVCTLGPATDTPEMIERLIRAGMDVARLNLSHGTLVQHAHYLKTIKRLNRKYELNVAVLMDLPGPKYRIGRITNNQVILKKGATVILTIQDIEGNAERLPINLPELPQDVRRGDIILLADGKLSLKVNQTGETDIKCRVLIGGLLETGKGLVVPGRHVSAPFITPAMKQDILFAAQQKPDFLALSFVGGAGNIEDVKILLRENGADIPIISKIEREEAVHNLDSILDASDAIMVARGDLGVEIPLEKVPLLQKDIILKCNRAGKPVITATEMLESMINTARPTRAEASDVANAIFDGTDAVMLSAETAIGKYPLGAVSMMARIALEAEKKLPYERILTERGGWIEPETDELISYNACHTAFSLKAAAIVAYTQSGSTARRVSRFRPQAPVLAISSTDKICGQLKICWGIFPIRGRKITRVSNMFETAVVQCRNLKIVKPGDLIIITGGIPIGQAGTTNMLKVELIK
ncbi:MAG: pyruvate kinase [Dehalococcoidales bacterium]|nr:pyruvate kinase [Dehalococcoidales bacterium]